jgi:hypothetical protein
MFFRNAVQCYMNRPCGHRAGLLLIGSDRLSALFYIGDPRAYHSLGLPVQCQRVIFIPFPLLAAPFLKPLSSKWPRLLADVIRTHT